MQKKKKIHHQFDQQKCQQKCLKHVQTVLNVFGMCSFASIKNIYIIKMNKIPEIVKNKYYCQSNLE